MNKKVEPEGIMQSIGQMRIYRGLGRTVGIHCLFLRKNFITILERMKEVHI